MKPKTNMQRFIGLALKCAAGLTLFVLSVADATSSKRTSCPADLPEGAQCYSGRGPHDAPYVIAIPENWNGTLFLHSRGATPADLSSSAALGPGRRLMPYGAAVAASNYRATNEAQSVVAHESAEDAENLRQIFVQAFGQPRITIASGSSFGGLVTAKLIELYGANSDGTQNYDGAFAACGVLGGETQLGYMRLDLRVVYQYYCQNHPRPDEVQYPLYLGLAPGQTMTQPELQARVNECTGIPEQRSETQQQNLANILSVVRIPEDALPFLMNFGTFTFQYLVQDRLEGRNPFPNRHVRYVGSGDDLALNHHVARYTSDREATAWLASSGDLTGDISIPVLTMHGIDDGRVFVENEAAYRETLEAAGTSAYLVQTFNNTSGHCTFSAPENVANLVALLSWIEKGVKPTRESIAEECENWRPMFGGECRFNNEYEPQPMATRVYPRHPHHKRESTAE